MDKTLPPVYEEPETSPPEYKTVQLEKYLELLRANVSSLRSIRDHLVEQTDGLKAAGLCFFWMRTHKQNLMAHKAKLEEAKNEQDPFEKKFLIAEADGIEEKLIKQSATKLEELEDTGMNVAGMKITIDYSWTFLEKHLLIIYDNVKQLSTAGYKIRIVQPRENLNLTISNMLNTDKANNTLAFLNNSMNAMQANIDKQSSTLDIVIRF